MFITDYNDETGRTLVIEEDDYSCWAYITQPDSRKIYMDCWLYNRINAPEEIDRIKFRNAPPPAVAGVLTPGYTPRDNIGESDISVSWKLADGAVYIKISGMLNAVMDFQEKRSYNRDLERECSWGSPLTEWQRGKI